MRMVGAGAGRARNGCEVICFGGQGSGMSKQDRKEIAGWFDMLRRCNVVDLSVFPLAKEVK